MDNAYFRVAAIIDYFDSDVSGGNSQNWKRDSRKSNVEFGKLFRNACDELKKESGNAHQQEGLLSVAHY